MLGEGIVSFGVACVADRRKVKSSPKISALVVQAAGDPVRLEAPVDRPALAPERHLHGRSVEPLDAADAELEIHQPVVAAELAVGHSLQADILLHAYRPRDRGILDAAQLLARDTAGRMVGARAQQLRRTQQAADMVGAERGHLVSLCVVGGRLYIVERKWAQGSSCDGNVRGGAWRLVGRLGVEEDAPLLRAAGHELWTPTYTGLGERAHLANAEVEPRHAHPRHRRGDRDGEPQRRDPDRPLLRRHGGDRRRGPRPRAHRQLVYLDAFAPIEGQVGLRSRSARHCREDARRRGAKPERLRHSSQPDAVRHRAGGRRMGDPAPAAAAAQGVLHKTAPDAEISLPRSYIYCTKTGIGDTFGQFAERAQREGWRYFEIDASHNPHITESDGAVGHPAADCRRMTTARLSASRGSACSAARWRTG